MSGFWGPLGLALAGGGAHGAWQAGAMRAFLEAGLEFEQIAGFSAGALSGAGWAFGILDVLERHWREVDQNPVLRFSPRWNPLALFSGEAIWEAVRYAGEDAEAAGRIRCELTVISLRVPQQEYDYARFSPRGAAGWDGPLKAKLVASCAIPGIFPPVEVKNGHGPQRLIDGGVPGREWIRFHTLNRAKTVLALQMTRPEEVGRMRLWPWDRFDQTGREVCYRQMASGIDSLLGLPEPPEIFRLYPSRRLSLSMLAFKSAPCIAAMTQGYEDARGFLRDPAPYRVQNRLLAPSAS